MDKQWVVLIDTGCDWPDVIFVGTWEDVTAFDRSIDDQGYSTSIQAVVTVDEIKDHEADRRVDSS